MLAERANGTVSADGSWVWDGVDPTGLAASTSESNELSYRSYVKKKNPARDNETKVGSDVHVAAETMC